jgi:hypothetical protein
LINQTLAGILNGTGQAGQIIIDQLVGAVTAHQGNLSSYFHSSVIDYSFKI